MKTLKYILGSIYPILIILLLLCNLKCCGKAEPSNPIDEPAFPDGSETTETTDTTAVGRAEVIGGTGEFKVTLLWDFEADIDLHVKQPNGIEIYYSQKKDLSTGGFLDVDDRNGGNGAAENIFWENPQQGEYDISLVYYASSARTSRAESGICKVVVMQGGREPITYEIPMQRVGDKRAVAIYNLN